MHITSFQIEIYYNVVFSCRVLDVGLTLNCCVKEAETRRRMIWVVTSSEVEEPVRHGHSENWSVVSGGVLQAQVDR